MKKLSVYLTLAMLICLLTACGSPSSSDEPSSTKPAETKPAETKPVETKPVETKPVETSQSPEENTRTDILYAVFSAVDIKEYPINYTGTKKNAEELANELSKLTGLDFNITASKTDDGLIVDWAANSTLVAGRDDREQKKDFFFYDNDRLCWFMMDSLWHTLTENLDAENIYYTMDGGQKLVFKELYAVKEFPSDIPYMGSEFYFAHAGNGEETDTKAAYQGFWKYPDGTILEISDERWNLYQAGVLTPSAGGPVEYNDEAAYLMNEDGSSGGGRVCFDENGNLTDSGNILTYHGGSLSGDSSMGQN